jgi:hypothetical protein
MKYLYYCTNCHSYYQDDDPHREYCQYCKTHYNYKWNTYPLGVRNILANPPYYKSVLSNEIKMSEFMYLIKNIIQYNDGEFYSYKNRFSGLIWCATMNSALMDKFFHKFGMFMNGYPQGIKHGVYWVDNCMYKSKTQNCICWEQVDCPHCHKCDREELNKII